MYCKKRIIRIPANETYDSHTAPLIEKFVIFGITKCYVYKLFLTHKPALSNSDGSFLSLAPLRLKSPFYSVRHADV